MAEKNMAEKNTVETNTVETKAEKAKKQSSRIETLEFLNKLIKDFDVDKKLGEDYFKGLDKNTSELSSYE
jgi:hypothetical protein